MDSSFLVAYIDAQIFVLLFNFDEIFLSDYSVLMQR